MFLQNDITLNAVWKKYISQEEKARARETCPAMNSAAWMTRTEA